MCREQGLSPGGGQSWLLLEPGQCLLVGSLVPGSMPIPGLLREAPPSTGKGESEDQPSPWDTEGPSKPSPAHLKGRVSENRVSLSSKELRHPPCNQLLQSEVGKWTEGSRTSPEDGGKA